LRRITSHSPNARTTITTIAFISSETTQQQQQQQHWHAAAETGFGEEATVNEPRLLCETL
jgi:hypothetical protein